MQHAVVGFFVKDRRVCLPLKLKGFGAGNQNGYGGRVEDGETEEEALFREIKEESGLDVRGAKITKVAVLMTFFGEEPKFVLHIFLMEDWIGEPKASEEMGEPEWFPFEAIPFDRMWVADKRWLSKILSGEKLRAVIRFSTDGKRVERFDPFEVEQF